MLPVAQFGAGFFSVMWLEGLSLSLYAEHTVVVTVQPMPSPCQKPLLVLDVSGIPRGSVLSLVLFSILWDRVHPQRVC